MRISDLKNIPKHSLQVFLILCPLFLTSCSTTELISNDQIDALMRVADAARESGNLKSTLHIIKRAQSIAPKDIKPMLAMGDTFSELGHYTKATEYYQMVIAREPDNTQALRGLIKTYLALNKPDLALEQMQVLLKTNSTETFAINSLGVLLDLNKDHQTAQACYIRGLKIDSDNIGLNNNYGLSLAMSKQYQPALDTLKKASKLAPNNQRIVHNFNLIDRYANKINSIPKNNKKSRAAIESQLQNNLIPSVDYSRAARATAIDMAKEYCG